MRDLATIEAQIAECDHWLSELDDAASVASPWMKAICHKWIDSWKGRRARLLAERGRLEYALGRATLPCAAVASQTVGESGG